MLRATNNGVTAIIDARGSVRARLPQFEAGVLRGDWQVMKGATPYARLGYLPLVCCLLALAAFAALARRRGTR
jgi:apolipoprotein N-acyltransferase